MDRTVSEQLAVLLWHVTFHGDDSPNPRNPTKDQCDKKNLSLLWTQQTESTQIQIFQTGIREVNKEYWLFNLLSIYKNIIVIVSHGTNKTDVSCRAITARRNISQKKSTIKKWMYRYMVIQEERSIFWEVIVWVISRETVHMNMCLITGYRDKAFMIIPCNMLHTFTFFSSKCRLFHNATFFVPVLVTFYIQGVLKFQCKI
jgi:hypothetical protein